MPGREMVVCVGERKPAPTPPATRAWEGPEPGKEQPMDARMPSQSVLGPRPSPCLGLCLP